MIEVSKSTDTTEATSLTPYEEAQDLSQEFAEIDRQTVDDSTIKCFVEGIYKTTTGGSISVVVTLPGTGTEESFLFTRPKVWSDEYDFVRWVSHYGYDSSNFEAMIQDNVEVEVRRKKNGDEYELTMPKTRVRRLVSRVLEYREAWRRYWGTSPREKISGDKIVKMVIGITVGAFLIHAGLFNGFIGWKEVTFTAMPPGDKGPNSERIAVLMMSLASAVGMAVYTAILISWVDR